MNSGNKMTTTQKSFEVHENLDADIIEVLLCDCEENDVRLSTAVHQERLAFANARKGFGSEIKLTGTNSKSRVRTPKQKRKADTSNTRSPWSAEEEIILQGVITDCTLVYGGSASWASFLRCYNIALQRFFAGRNCEKFPGRSQCALKKHYGLMYAKLGADSGRVSSDFWFRVYHDRWMSEDFNKYQKLLSYNDILEVTI